MPSLRPLLAEMSYERGVRRAVAGDVDGATRAFANRERLRLADALDGYDDAPRDHACEWCNAVIPARAVCDDCLTALDVVGTS